MGISSSEVVTLLLMGGGLLCVAGAICGGLYLFVQWAMRQ